MILIVPSSVVLLHLLSRTNKLAAFMTMQVLFVAYIQCIYSYRRRYFGGQETRCYEWCFREEEVGPRKMQLEIHGFETLLIVQRISPKQGARCKVEVQEPPLGRFYPILGYGCAGCQRLYHSLAPRQFLKPAGHNYGKLLARVCEWLTENLKATTTVSSNLGFSSKLVYNLSRQLRSVQNGCFLGTI